MRHTKSMLYLAIFNLFLVFLGVGLVIPVMPLLQQSLGLSGTTMGLLVSVFALFQLIVSPLAGMLSDKIGRKIMIASGMFLFGISEFIFGASSMVEWLYISRALGGVSAAFLMPAVTAYVADVTTFDERAKAMGLVSASISGGFIIGPGIGGLLIPFGMRTPFFAAAAVAFIGGVMTLLILKEPDKKTSEQSIKDKGAIRSILTNAVFAFPFLVILVSSFGLQSFESIYSIMAVVNFGFTTTEIAMIVTFSGILALVFQVALFDKIIRLIGEVGLIRIAFFVSAIFVAVIAMTTNKWVVVLSTFVVFLAFDLLRPGITTYLSRHAGDKQGTVNGLNSMFTSIGNILGPIVAGSLFDINTVYPYFISAIILFFTSILALFWKKV